MAGLTPEQLVELLNSPQRVTGDQGTIVNRSVDDILKADRYLRGVECDRHKLLQSFIAGTSPLPWGRYQPADTVEGGIDAVNVMGPYEYETPSPHGLVMPTNLQPIPVFVDASGNVLPAQANASTTLHNAFVVSVPGPSRVIIQLGGLVEVLGHGLTVGQYYFLSDAVAGEALLSPPQIDAPVWFVQTASQLVLQTQRPLERGT